ncbi:MAG TPA: hypothetical protein VL043_04560 [Protaetiibacter sp.]|nr:hypothetical protein [Protaetiibacter sp.]
MTEIIIDAGTLHFNAADLTATGLLVPYGVKARSNLGEFTVEPGVFEIPTDTTGIGLNIEHQREQVVGGVERVWEQPEAGILAAFRWRNDAAGRAAFEEGRSGKRKHLSVEAAGVKIQGGKAIAGRVFGAAQVERPAFEGATLLAAEDTETVPLPPPTVRPDGDGHLPVLSETLPADITVTTPAGDSAVYLPDNPAEETPTIEGSGTLTANTPAAPAAVPASNLPGVPATLLATAPTAPPQEATPVEQAYELGQIFGAMAQVKTGMHAPDAEMLLAALSDIKVNAAGGLTTAASGVIQPGWVGKLWQGKRYQRKYIDLLNHTYGPIQIGGRKGFKLAQGTALVTKWSGNKSEIGSGTATTSVTGSTIQPYGYAADVAREWYDLEGGAEVIQAFFEGVVDSYAKVTDLDALTTIFGVASKTAADLDRLVAPGTFPTEYPDAMGILIQAIEAIQDADDDPSFAIVNPVAWSQLLYTPKDLVPEFVSFAVSTSGEATADGKVTVRKAPASAFVGLDATEPQVIAGAKNAIEFRELGETPIQVDALDIAKGGIDKAVIGYLETFVVRPEAVVLVGTEAA